MLYILSGMLCSACKSLYVHVHTYHFPVLVSTSTEQWLVLAGRKRYVQPTSVDSQSERSSIYVFFYLHVCLSVCFELYPYINT